VRILDGCHVVTVDAERTEYSDGAIAIDGARIAAVGDREDVKRQYPDAEIIDARGKVAFPGFVNIHTHTVLTMLRGSCEDLGGGGALYGQMYPMRRILNAEDRTTLGLLGCVEALRFGCTTIVENYQGARDVVPSLAKLKVRGVASEIVNDGIMHKIGAGQYEFSMEQAHQQMQTSIDMVEKWHNTENGRITCQLSAHAPDTCTREVLEMVRDEAEKRDLGLHIHLAQSPREVAQVEAREGMRPIEFLESTGFLGPRTIAAHCIQTMPHEVTILGRTRTNIAHCAFVFAKGGSVGPIMGLAGAGANIALGSDNMSEDMIQVMRSSMIGNRIRESGVRNAVLPPRPSSYEILEWMTIGGAKALGMENEIGSLEQGKKADITMLDYRKLHLTPKYDPVGALSNYAISSDVDTVIVDGEVLVESGAVKIIDETEVIEAAQKQADDFWKRFEAEYGGRVLKSA
jgi:5-methylthioadenosine/S-adenosylhomocysteine deaminase